MKFNRPARQTPVQPESAPGPEKPGLNGKQKKLLFWLPLWLCAALLLIGNLGVEPVKGSESRWLEVVREMFLTNDFLHPTINFEPYYDKPLLTYWFIVLTSLFNGKTVNEFLARLPSVLAAAAALMATVSIAKRLWNAEIARLSGWLFLTCYSFAWWGRLAEADMANLAFSTGAIAWYLAFRKTKSFPGYLGFFLLCFIGAHAKGMAAIAVPLLAVGVDMLLAKKVLFHLNWKSALALLIGIGVYMIPFELSKLIAPAVAPETQELIDADGTLKTSGIALALRENIIRFFAPFDHDDEPFYAYFIHLPRLLLPWSPFMILAVIDAFRRHKQFQEAERWLCWTLIAIFLFFSISGSRRPYYILPAVPFCAILMALYLSREYKFLLRLVPQSIVAALAAVFILGMFLFHLRSEPPFTEILPDVKLAKSIFSIYVSLLVVFVYVIPTASQFRTLRYTFRQMMLRAEQMRVPDENIYFYQSEPRDAIYYLNRKTEIAVIEDEEELEKLRREKPETEVLLDIAFTANGYAAFDYSLSREENEDRRRKEETAIRERIRNALESGAEIYTLRFGKLCGFATERNSIVENLYVLGQFQKLGLAKYLLRELRGQIPELRVMIPDVRKKDTVRHICETLDIPFTME